MATVIVLNNAQMGHGDAELGRKILATALRKISSITDLEAIVMFTSGVLLAATDSPVATELRLLHENGVEVVPCATCVDHYGLRDRLVVPRPGSMDEILAMMKNADKVITL